MRILTADEIRKVEKLAFERYFSEAELMKNAGLKCAEKIIKNYGELIKGEKVSVLCGNGKNAGDGFVISKALCEFGAVPQIVICDKEPQIDEPIMYYNEALEYGVESVHFNEAELSDTLIVDCIFGIGFHGEPREPFSAVFDAVNNSKATVVSVDTPSGTNASDGSVYLARDGELT